MENRDIILNLVLASGSILLVILFFEISLQTDLIKSPYGDVEIVEGPPERISYHPGYGWTRPPYSVFLERKPGESGYERYSHNSEGFRDLYSSGNTTVVVLGDSFTYGVLVGNNETFPQILDRRHRDAKFLNYGMSGYSTAQQLEVYHDIDTGHDAVLLAYYLGNDMKENQQHRSHLGTRPIYSVENGSPELKRKPVRTRKSLFEKAYFETPIYRLETPRLLYKTYQASSRGGNRGENASTEALNLTRSLLLEINRIAENRDSQLYIAVIPERRELSENRTSAYWNRQRAMLEELENKTNVGLLDLKEELENSSGDPYGEINPHLNEEGHKILARKLEQVIE